MHCKLFLQGVIRQAKKNGIMGSSTSVRGSYLSTHNRSSAGFVSVVARLFAFAFPVGTIVLDCDWGWLLSDWDSSRNIGGLANYSLCGFNNCLCRWITNTQRSRIWVSLREAGNLNARDWCESISVTKILVWSRFWEAFHGVSRVSRSRRQTQIVANSEPQLAHVHSGISHSLLEKMWQW